MISGLLVLVPLVITWFIVQFLYNISVGALVPILDAFAVRLPDYVKPVIAFAVVIGVIYVAGLLAGNYAGRKVIALGEALLQRIPIVKTVYSASKQVVDTFTLKDKEGFKRVALIEYPRPGIYALGFVTGDIVGLDGLAWYKVFVPTTPNPTSGFLEIVPSNQAILLDMSVEDAVKVIMSGGILSPESLLASKGEARGGPDDEVATA